MRESGLMNRRTLITAGSLAVATATGARSSGEGGSTPFTRDTLLKAAESLAAQPFKKAKPRQEELLKRLRYDQYRDIRFDPDRSLWRGENLGHEIQFFPLGWLYDEPVQIHVVENGVARPFDASRALFQIGPLAEGEAGVAATQGFSGFRLHRAINRPDYLDEYAVFQGASYFRCVARGQAYGLSARGLSINTAQPAGEEFPRFREFWIEKPPHGADRIVLHALLDSQSVAGAYSFTIIAGAPTITEVQATLFPRRELMHIGLAPLTSMYLTGPAWQKGLSDFRPAVHDSEGLAILSGRGEQIWRPLTNPKVLQSSAFLDMNPRGFGLMQRDRRFSSYEDLEARYERRPSCWVEPQGDWGEGSVDLIEIPTDEEIHDNIAAFWRPRLPMTPGRGFSYAYRLSWLDQRPRPTPTYRVGQTRTGAGRKAGQHLFVVDFEGDGLAPPNELPKADLQASPGGLETVVVQHNPECRGYRVSFTLVPGSATTCELRLLLQAQAKPISETWLYRWTRS